MARQAQYRNEDAIQKLGERIRAARINENMSQQRLAELCDLEISQINRIELGKINTSVSHLFLIAEKLNVKARDLLDFE